MPMSAISMALLTKVEVFTHQTVIPRSDDELFVIASVTEIPVVDVQTLTSPLLQGQTLRLTMTHPRGLRRPQRLRLIFHLRKLLRRRLGEKIGGPLSEFEVDDVA